MAAANERIPVLVSSQEKARIARQAKDAGLSMGEFLRRAAAAFRPDHDDIILEGMIDQMIETSTRANAAIDDALAFVAASNERMSKLETQRKEPPDGRH